jgi:hypothetical protein
MTEHHVDANERTIEVGTRVRIAGVPDDLPHGVVTRISDPDGDADDEGRPIGINPRVFVKFDDSDEDSFTTSWTGTYAGDEGSWMCDELEVE